jgi:hypothetical protein
MRDGIVGFVGVFAEPEIRILDPLHVGVGLAGRVEVEIGIRVPGEEVARIAPATGKNEFVAFEDSFFCR